MKIHYKVSYEGIIDASHEDWDDLKEDYANDKEQFAKAAVSEKTREFNEDVITITKIEE